MTWPNLCARYEKARKLKDLIDEVRAKYTRDWTSRDRKERQVRPESLLSGLWCATPAAAAAAGMCNWTSQDRKERQASARAILQALQAQGPSPCMHMCP